VSLIEKVIKEAREQLERDEKPDRKVLFVPRMNGKTEYTAKEVSDEVRDPQSELGKMARRGVRKLFRMGIR
jgi:hypothetical protein